MMVAKKKADELQLSSISSVKHYKQFSTKNMGILLGN